MASKGLRTGIQAVLAIVIAGLGYYLYVSITEPYEAILRQEALTEQTRDRMDDIRYTMIRHNELNDRYAATLDSLLMFVKQDSLITLKADSLFGPGFVLDSLIYSPRTGKRFELAVNDTGRVAIYLLSDPDSDDKIGSLTPDITMINAASWE